MLLTHFPFHWRYVCPAASRVWRIYDSYWCRRSLRLPCLASFCPPPPPAHPPCLVLMCFEQGKRPKRPDPTGSDPRVKELESKLEELKRIGDRIKEKV